MYLIKKLEELRDELWEDRQNIYELLADHLEELTSFQLGRHQGEINALTNVIELLRYTIKYIDNDESDTEL